MPVSAHNDVVRFADCELYLGTRELQKHGVRIKLREQSVQVLAALLEHPGSVVSREQLSHLLWGDDVFVDFDNNLNAIIAHLREALCDPAEQHRYIETVPRRGYRFVAAVEGVLPEAERTTARDRLLVLPFLNLSGDPAQEYFSDAITDELITALAGIAPEQLAVIARTTAMRYKGARKDIARIARELKTDYVVEGGVRREGDEVHVNVQLIACNDESHLFAKGYRGGTEDIFRLQRSVARGIAAHLPTLAQKRGSKQGRRNPTESIAAYHQYIKGRYEMWKWTPESVAAARQYFEAALSLDANFAMACDALANLYGYLGLWGFVPPEEAEPMRWFYGLRAYELDPTLAEARCHVAYHPRKCHYGDPYSYNWQEAERLMAQARDTNRNSATVRVRHASVLIVLGRWKEALAELECAFELDPMSVEVHFWLLWVYFLARQPGGLPVAQRLVELEPQHHISHMMLGITYMGMKRFDASIAELQRAVELSQEFPFVVGWLGLALGLGGEKAEVLKLLESLGALAKHQFVLPTTFAWMYLGLGERDEALGWMNRAAEHNDEWIHPLRSYPFLDPLRSDPRFIALLRKLNLAAVPV